MPMASLCTTSAQYTWSLEGVPVFLDERAIKANKSFETFILHVATALHCIWPVGCCLTLLKPRSRCYARSLKYIALRRRATVSSIYTYGDLLGVIIMMMNKNFVFKVAICLRKLYLAKISSCSLDIAHSARNLGFIFDEHVSFSDQISALSKSCYSHIRQLICIRPYLDHKTACLLYTSPSPRD